MKRGHASDAHCGAVLGLDSGEVAGNRATGDSFLRVHCRTGDIEAVDRGHILHSLERTDLLRDLLALTDDIIGHRAVAAEGHLLLLLGDKEINTVEPEHDGSRRRFFRGRMYPEDLSQCGSDARPSSRGCKRRTPPGYVSSAVLIEDLVVLLVDLIAVGLSGLLSHSDTAVRHERALQRLVCLKSDDRLEVRSCVRLYIAGPYAVRL